MIPLVIGFIGLHFIRIEHSGYKFLDSLNKNINTNSFNAVLSLLIIFVIIKATPPILSGSLLMLVLQEIAKMFALDLVHVGHISKFGLTDLCMECILMLNNGE